MKTAIKPKTKKPTKPLSFAEFLDAFPRERLTFDENIARRDGKGVTVEEFVREGEKRGVRLRVGTAYKWRWKRAIPRASKLDELLEAFQPEGLTF